MASITLKNSKQQDKKIGSFCTLNVNILLNSRQKKCNLHFMFEK